MNFHGENKLLSCREQEKPTKEKLLTIYFAVVRRKFKFPIYLAGPKSLLFCDLVVEYLIVHRRSFYYRVAESPKENSA